ncbi:hypothetical protein N9D35_02205 [Gammaproteobacteria bacterium]|nr:hypothetical protein [Gammaproteobacteria bacterium]
MSFFKNISKRSYVNKVLKAAEECRSFYRPIRENSYNFDRYINHSLADKLSPEESILYMIGNELSDANCYSDAYTLGIMPSDIDDRGRSFHEKELICLNAWFELTDTWRDLGKISSHSKNEFETIIKTTVARWPQLGEGFRPKEFVFYSVHYDEFPPGLGTLNPNYGLEVSPGIFYCDDTHSGLSIDFEEKKIPTFSSFMEAKEYVLAHETEPLWWYREDISSIIDAGGLPEWTPSMPPEDLKPPSRLEYGYNSYRNSDGACCVFAWPKASYEETKSLFNRTGDKYSYDPEFRGINFVNAWTIRKVEIAFPIDNEDQALVEFWKRQ